MKSIPVEMGELVGENNFVFKIHPRPGQMGLEQPGVVEGVLARGNGVQQDGF